MKPLQPQIKKPKATKPRAARKRKADLVALQCREGCQIAHTIGQTAVLLQCSPKHIRSLLKAGILRGKNAGIGKRKHIRIPHPELNNLPQLTA